MTWFLRLIGKGRREREVPLPADVVGDQARHLVRENSNSEDVGATKGAFLLGNAGHAS